jgi:hypothetical protein
MTDLQQPYRKFEEIKSCPSRYKIKTPQGYRNICNVFKTIPYKKWYIKLENGEDLYGADTHILYTTDHQSIYLKDIKIGQPIETDTGYYKCVQLEEYDDYENMYDVEVDSVEHEYYTNGMTSHNTTCSALYILWYVMFKKDKTVAILANKADTAKSILEEIKYAYERMPEYLKPGVKEYNAFSVKFDNNSEIICKATSADAIRGQSISLLMLDEFAFVPSNIADSFWASNYPTLSCLPKDTIILTENGMHEIGDFIPEESQKGDYIQIEGLNVWGKNGIEPASHFYVSPKSETNIIKTKYGLVHESTLDHPIYTIDSSGIGMKKSSDIHVGDFVRVDYGMDIYGQLQRIDYEDEYTDDYGKIHHLKVPKMDLSLAYIFGGFIASGWVEDFGKVHIDVKDPEAQRVYTNHKHLRFFIDRNNNIVADEPTSKFIIHMTKDAVEDYGNKVPKCIRTSTKRTQQNFIAGVIESVGVIDGDGDVVLYLDNNKLATHIQMMLLNMGIISYIKSNKKQERLTIPKYFHADIMRFGLKISENKKSIKELSVAKEHKDKFYKIPMYPWVVDEIKNILAESNVCKKDLIKRGINIDKLLKVGKTVISRSIIVDLLSLCGVQNEKLQQLVAEQCFYDEVVSKESNVNTTYDLTCPQTHTFLQNGILGSNTGGSCIIVSTPNGTGNLYYKIWKSAIQKENMFVPIKVDWAEVPDRDERWKEETIKNIGKIRFAQEFGCQFFGSTTTLIDSQILIDVIKKVDPIEIINEDTKYWAKPIQGRKYALSIDVSAGVKSDYSVINVFDITDFNKTYAEQVCCFRRNDIKIEDFTDVVHTMAKYWNNGHVIIEVNGNLGQEILNKLKDEPYEYENVFYDYDRKTEGIYATKTNKPVACLYFKELIENKRMIIRDEQAIDELSYFEEIRPGIYKAKAGTNFFDDCVMTAIWMAYFLKSKYYEDIMDDTPIINPDGVDDSFSKWQIFLRQDREDNGENWLDTDVNGPPQSPKSSPDVWW